MHPYCITMNHILRTTAPFKIFDAIIMLIAVLMIDLL